jgi:hypothetical protein
LNSKSWILIGRVYASFPKNGQLDHFDFANAARAEPQLAGYYRVSGGRIEFAWFAGRKPESSSFARNGDTLNFLGRTWWRVDTDPQSFRPDWLVGTYRWQTGAGFNNVAGVISRFYSWKADRTFLASHSGVAITNAPVPQGSQSRSAAKTGTYTLSGTTLTLRFSDGTIEPPHSSSV